MIIVNYIFTIIIFITFSILKTKKWLVLHICAEKIVQTAEKITVTFLNKLHNYKRFFYIH